MEIPKRNAVSAAILATIGMLLVVYASYKDRGPTMAAVEPETQGQQSAVIETVPVETVATQEETTEEPTTEESTEAPIALYDVPLDADLQLHIIRLCEEAHIAEALVFAMIERESDYRADCTGDNGNSLGLMQIQPKWHQWRMDALGGGDWFNPYDNVAVGIHILSGLFSKYGDDIYMVLMAYNGGCSYAERMAAKGIYSNYAIEVTARAEELERGQQHE